MRFYKTFFNCCYSIFILFNYFCNANYLRYHFYSSTVATVHRTRAVPAMPSFAASDLFPAANRRPPHHTQQLGHGFVQGSIILHNFSFLANHKKIVGKTEGGHNTVSRKRYSSSLIRANLMPLLTPYSSHERN